MISVEQHEFLLGVLQGNTDAADFCETLFSVSQTLDDLIDKDRPISDGQVIQAFWDALIEIPGNVFYQTHFLFLRPLMASALQDWTDSVALERSKDTDCLNLAFVLRDQLTGLVIQCAYLIGGTIWMREVGPKVRAFFHDESLDAYLADFQE